MSTLKQRFAELKLERPDVTQADLARATGAKPPSVNDWFTGETKSMKLTTATKAAALYGVNPLWLSDGEGEKYQPIGIIARARAGSTMGDAPKLIDLENNPEYPAIRKVKFKLSAGASGFGVDYEGEDHDPIVFGAYWYKVNKLRPEALFAVRVANGSMEPGLHNGDIVVVNTASTDPRDGVVFAINYEGEMVIKRLIRDDGEWWLHSDNPDQIRYKRKRMHADCFLIGEVIQKQSMRI